MAKHKNESMTDPDAPKAGEATGASDDVYYDDFDDYDTGPTDLVELVVFSIGGTRYALMVDDVEEVINLGALTFVPRAGAHVLGIASVRGSIVPVIEFARLVMGNVPEGVEGCKLLIVKTDSAPLGLRVDKKVVIMSLSQSQIKEAPPEMEENNFVSGVFTIGESFVALLNADKIRNITAIGGEFNESKA